MLREPMKLTFNFFQVKEQIASLERKDIEASRGNRMRIGSQPTIEQDILEETEDRIICVIAPLQDLPKIRRLLHDNGIGPLRKQSTLNSRNDRESILLRTKLRGGDGWPCNEILSSIDSSTIFSLNGIDTKDVTLAVIIKSTEALRTRSQSKQSSSIRVGARAWLECQPESLFNGIENDVEAYCAQLPLKYTKYSNLLLLPPNTFESYIWQNLLKRLDTSATSSLYGEIAKTMRVTHIATNRSIPEDVVTGDSVTANILRSPSDIVPLYGSFGPIISTAPTTKNFDSCFWVAHSQNGISQHWCPLYTMFSRGNVKEKTRLLHLPTLSPPKLDPAQSTAVDLYAGIGYFAFCYKAKGFRTVLCWDLNPWSLQGMKKGALANGWDMTFAKSSVGEQQQILSEDGPIQGIVAFEEDNANALSRIQSFRHRIPPVRHVNCGLLPSSAQSWRTAVRALDPELGGWIHIHENINPNDANKCKSEIVESIRAFAKAEANDLAKSPRRVWCESVNFVKSFSPKKDHVVFDVWASGLDS